MSRLETPAEVRRWVLPYMGIYYPGQKARIMRRWDELLEARWRRAMDSIAINRDTAAQGKTQ